MTFFPQSLGQTCTPNTKGEIPDKQTARFAYLSPIRSKLLIQLLFNGRNKSQSIPVNKSPKLYFSHSGFKLIAELFLCLF